MTAQQAKPGVPARCYHCHEPITSPVICRSCENLQPYATEVTYFELFGLPQRYDVSPDEVHRRFLALSRSTHPDYFAQDEETVRAMSLRLTAQINDAYRVLTDPIARAEYLLRLAGGPTNAEDKTVPAGLLAETMELSEEIEAARGRRDTEALAAIRDRLSARLDEARDRIADLARRLAEGSRDTVRQLRAELNGIRYIQNLLGRLG